ncbi:hypothetical protein GQ44DRAFT_744106 [Phaeosphaeriaceae sp. PMI808]|nr:hypothetical protein GQ44DRAFT_744106 [Phaeosphaeriaceae sp. PMI808]
MHHNSNHFSRPTTTTRPATTTRPRRASASSQPRPPTPQKSMPTKTLATDEDAQRAGIPTGYSYKNWDPSEEPIMLLGSVFDANSLGKWIFDWTIFYHKSAIPFAKMAGELWILLIHLANKVKMAEEVILKICGKSKKIVLRFLKRGKYLWVRFTEILKVCGDNMWKAAEKENDGGERVSIGKNSCHELVNTLFGRDRELEKTESLMASIRHWSMCFDANCNAILNRPF